MSAEQAITIAKSIVTHGTAAVIEYRRMTGTEQDNRVPEVFLHSWIACGIHRDFSLQAHVERSYETLAAELGKQGGADLIESLGQKRADVALYKDGAPKAVIEIKKYDEGGNDTRVQDDLAKMRSLAAGTKLEVYLAVLVTDIRRKQGGDRVKALADSLGGIFDELGPPQVANEGKADWSWFFACGAFS